MFDSVLPALVTIISTALASTGFWAWVQHRRQGSSATDRLLMGVAYEKIALLGDLYIARGYITRSELDDLHKYLYEPYKILGGNGTIDRIMSSVENLPLKSQPDSHRRITIPVPLGDDHNAPTSR